MVELSLEPRAVKLAVGTSILSGLLALRWLLQPKQKSFRKVPGVWFLGVLPQLGPGGENAGIKFDEFADKYGQEGVFEMVLTGSRMVCLNSWPLISKILDMRPFKAVKPGSLEHAAKGMVQGVFFSEGEQWKRERRLISPAFNAKSVASYVPAMTRTTQTLLRTLRRDAEKGDVNFTELLPLYTADVLCATAFGKDLGMLETRKTELVQDVKTMLGALSIRSFVQIPYWKIPIIGRYLDGGNAATDRLGHTVKALMNEQAGQGATVVEKFRQMDGDKLSHQDLVGNLIVLFGAGTDTTSVALSWAFYHLARDQQLQQIVADEVKDLPEEVSPQHLDSLLQVHALWLEVLRFNGPAPFEITETREEVEIDGRVVKPGAEVLLCYRHVLKNAPELKAKLGDDLHAFRPSRWLGPEGIVKCPPFDSLPFGHGARVCLGKQLADYEGRLVIAQVVRHFVLEKWQGPPLREKTSFVVLPAEDVKISLKPRPNAK